MTWVDVSSTEGLWSPKPTEPLACENGWTSHEWVISIHEGRVSLHSSGCEICDEGVSDLESDYIYGEFCGRLKFHKDVGGSYETPEIDVYWTVEPLCQSSNLV